jgi:hypothetical protein
LWSKALTVSRREGRSQHLAVGLIEQNAAVPKPSLQWQRSQQEKKPGIFGDAGLLDC